MSTSNKNTRLTQKSTVHRSQHLINSPTTQIESPSLTANFRIRRLGAIILTVGALASVTNVGQTEPAKSDAGDEMTVTTKTLPPAAHGSAPVAASTPKPKKKSPDALTKAALKRAHKNEINRESQTEVVTSSDQVGPIITKPTVTSQPAPGVVAKAAPGPAPRAKAESTGFLSHGAIETPVAEETTPQKARELIMTSHVHVGDGAADGAGDDSTTTEAEAPVVIRKPAPMTRPADATGSAPITGASLVQNRISAPGSAVSASKVNSESPLAPVSAAPSHEAGTAKNLAAEQSLKWLVNGNTRYASQNFRADGRSATDRERLLRTGQKPHAILLSCSDSVVPPETIFDQSLGELYSVRTLGETIDSASIASLEYAVTYLGPQLLVVMGHTKCDAIQGVLQIKENQNAGSEFLNKLLSDIRGHLETFTSEKHSPALAVEATLNADGVARELMNRSEIIRKKVESGELLIKTALYRGDSGKVTFY